MGWPRLGREGRSHLTVTGDELNYLFAPRPQQNLLSGYKSKGHRSAVHLRNMLFHDLGPSHAKKVNSHAKHLIPKLMAFLDCRQQVLDHLEHNFADVP